MKVYVVTQTQSMSDDCRQTDVLAVFSTVAAAHRYIENMRRLDRAIDYTAYELDVWEDAPELATRFVLSVGLPYSGAKPDRVIGYVPAGYTGDLVERLEVGGLGFASVKVVAATEEDCVAAACRLQSEWRG